MPRIVVLKGGCSSEREVSLVSGRAVADALRREGFDVAEIDLTSESLPAGIDPARDVIFPVMHGGYGEGGGLQKDLEKAGFAYAGCNGASSEVCMDKPAAKKLAEAAGVRVAGSVVLDDSTPMSAGEIAAKLGTDLVAKPACEGSSVGLAIIGSMDELSAWLDKPRKGVWLVEERIRGRELTCGVLEGVGMGIVQIVPAVGVYDFKSKYTPGSTNYIFPAPISEKAADIVRRRSEAAFSACGCRDYARADFIMPDGAEPVFLELNTLPGMTPTSLLPKSASCVGLSFEKLVRRMIASAIARMPAHAIS
ncbi:MAG TPA: D-alanine--D-alanine ligase [Opitutales bacterium]|nr:D-alanine--D-alanine ligase [Opitutales bacterium]